MGDSPKPEGPLPEEKPPVPEKPPEKSFTERMKRQLQGLPPDDVIMDPANPNLRNP